MNETPFAQDIVYSLILSPQFELDSTCFAARQSGLYRSTDRGNSWQQMLPAPTAVTAVALSPDFASDHTLFAAIPGAILCSRDGGYSWQSSSLNGGLLPVVSALCVSPNFKHDGTILVGTVEDGVYLSTHGGDHFHRWNFGLLDLNIHSLVLSPDFARDHRALMGTESGIFRSDNYGRSWREVNFPMLYAPVVSLALVSDDMWLAGTPVGLFCSVDKGDTWEWVDEYHITGPVNQIALAANPDGNPVLVIALDRQLFISRDNGRSWADFKTSALLVLQHDINALVLLPGSASDVLVLAGLVDGTVLHI